ncbi:hypothetical protein CI102_1063 [Trichoderma harzianum]|nr:hypothetical protein CI102_1063 [Trichoderma harzianum]
MKSFKRLKQKSRNAGQDKVAIRDPAMFSYSSHRLGIAWLTLLYRCFDLISTAYVSLVFRCSVWRRFALLFPLSNSSTPDARSLNTRALRFLMFPIIPKIMACRYAGSQHSWGDFGQHSPHTARICLAFLAVVPITATILGIGLPVLLALDHWQHDNP